MKNFIVPLLCPIQIVDTLVTFVMQLNKLRDDCDDDGQLIGLRRDRIQLPVVVSKSSSKFAKVA